MELKHYYTIAMCYKSKLNRLQVTTIRVYNYFKCKRVTMVIGQW